MFLTIAGVIAVVFGAFIAKSIGGANGRGGVGVPFPASCCWLLPARDVSALPGGTAANPEGGGIGGLVVPEDGSGRWTGGGGGTPLPASAGPVLVPGTPRFAGFPGKGGFVVPEEGRGRSAGGGGGRGGFDGVGLSSLMAVGQETEGRS
jgi:hypothetical protein